MPPLERVIDPTRCWIRHVYADPANGAAIAVGGTKFSAQPLDGVNGRQGWQRADVTPALSDSGEGTITLPNTVGDDGILHRDRFKIVTNADYRIGDEWLEVMREPHDVIAVVTPVDYTTGRADIVIKVRTAEVLTELDYGPGLERVIAGPRDLVRRAGRAQIAVATTEFAGQDPAAGLPAPWTGGAPTWETGAEGLVLQGGVSTYTQREFAITTTDTDWEAYAQVRVTTVGNLGAFLVVQLAGGVFIETSVAANGSTQAYGFSQSIAAKNRVPSLTLPGEVDLRIVKDGRWLSHFVNGTLVAMYEAATPTSPPALLRVQAPPNARVVVRRSGILTRRAILTAGVGGDMHLPGKPTPGGLKGRYWDESNVQSRQTTNAARYAAMVPANTEPRHERLDPTINFASGATWKPANVPSAWFSARWTGAIYLDLAAADRKLRLNLVDDQARVWVGRTDWTDPAIASWNYAGGVFTDVRSPALRSHLGTSKAGWYPIVIEYAQGAGNGGIILEDSALDGGGNPIAWGVVAASRLSPFGIIDDTYRHEPRRKLLDDAAASYGIQWRTEPGTLESGQFPGRIVPYVRAGRDTDLIVNASESVQPTVTADATDAVDVLIADAAGIATPGGTTQLTAAAINPGCDDGNHMQVITGYESLAEITEPALLQQRLSTMLALRGSPNEQVGVQPHGRRELTDTFPLTGAAARMDWQPGDGVRLNLPEIGVLDIAPRQIIRPTWSLVPGGVAALTASFRQRPRNVRETLRSMWRATLAPNRTYQGQLSWITGTLGSSNPAAYGATDAWSRVSIPPPGIGNIVKAVLIVEIATGAGWAITVGASTVVPGNVDTAGEYDVTGWLNNSTGELQVYARMTGGAGAYAARLMLLVSV